MAADDQHDARGSARVLAVIVRNGIKEDYAPLKHKSAFNNLYRLLEAYRAHRFVGFEYQPRPARGPEALTMLAQERNVVELRLALDRAFDAIFEDRVQGVEFVENVLRSIAYPGKANSQDIDRERASAFLSTFIDNLRTVR
jgi:hypothetical protein